MSSIFIDPVPGRCWPLHPQPADWEDLETWVRRIADTYGVSYDAFLLNALGHTGGGARDLDHAPVHVLARLSAGTGTPIERLRDMTTQRSWVVRRNGRGRDVKRLKAMPRSIASVRWAHAGGGACRRYVDFDCKL